jgi:ubiquinone/menaquinone biosynthesis C-methylase UbiE
MRRRCRAFPEEDRVTGQQPAEPDRRSGWAYLWEQQRDERFGWSLDGVAPQLQELVESGRVPAGLALDLGCGAGESTAFLGEHFTLAVGIDVAPGAVRQAARRIVETGSSSVPAFAVADAGRLPFQARSFAFVFDRGCLQNMPERAWAAYFHEVERLLIDGGVHQLLVSKAEPAFPPWWTSRGLKKRWRWYVGRRRPGPQFLSHDYLRRAAGPSMHVESLVDFPFRTKSDQARLFTHAIFTKR